MLEWNLPPLRFREAGTADFYVSLGAARALRERHGHEPGLRADLGTDAARHVVENVGAQLDFRIFALSRLELTLSVGQACGLRGGDGTRVPRRWSRSRS